MRFRGNFPEACTVPPTFLLTLVTTIIIARGLHEGPVVGSRSDHFGFICVSITTLRGSEFRRLRADSAERVEGLGVRI